VVLIGKDEVEKGSYTLRNMQNKQQAEVYAENFIYSVTRMLLMD